MKEQINRLRELMNERNIDCYIITTTDAHNSEYVSERDMVLKYMSGFSGSNGTLLVTMDEALLWTDGRYYIQCEKELKGSGIKMMRQGDDRDPSIDKYIAKHCRPEWCIGFDGDCITKYLADQFVSKCAHPWTGIRFDYDDLAGKIWDESGLRPEASQKKVYEHDIKYAGLSVKDKLKSVAEKMNELNCSHFFISKLDDIMWLFNIRGEDVAFNPVAFSYALVNVSKIDDKSRTVDGSGISAVLFIKTEYLDENVSDSLKEQGVSVMPYDSVHDYLGSCDFKGNVLADKREVSVKAYDLISERLKGVLGLDGSKAAIVSNVNPTTELKAVKNDTEIGWMKEFFKRDSIAMTRYLYAVKKIMGCKIDPTLEDALKKAGLDKVDDYIHDMTADNFDEVKAGKLCDRIRLDTEGCFDLSFTTIAAYGPNAAMMHYEATEESYSKCERHGMLLTDCGGQYPGATTDVTRTIAIGPVSDEEKKHFTLVLKGWLALMHATWIEGCTGRNLDILARQYLWNEGIDYKCGTGHGVGYCLGVHEGPQNIRWKYLNNSAEAILHPGMVVTNEPGVYIEGKYGIRTENTMLIVKKFDSDGDTYLGFENLTLVPIDMDLIDQSLLDDKEKGWIEDYQSSVYEVIASYDIISGSTRS